MTREVDSDGTIKIKYLFNDKDGEQFCEMSKDGIIKLYSSKHSSCIEFLPDGTTRRYNENYFEETLPNGEICHRQLRGAHKNK